MRLAPAPLRGLRGALDGPSSVANEMSTWLSRRILVPLVVVVVSAALLSLILRNSRPIMYACWLLLLVFVAYAARNIPRRYRQHGLGEMEQALDHKVGIFWRSYEIKPLGPGGSGKVGRNDPCPCGSEIKYKRCCGADRS